MAKNRLIQSNFTSGEIAPTLRARIDIEKYYNGCAKAENVIILPHGGLRRRPGLAKATDSKATGAVRIESFEFSVTQTYLILFEVSAIKIYKDGVLQSTEVSPYNTEAIIRNVDVIQSADTMIMVHEDFAPQRLQRQGSDTAWALTAVPLVNIPIFDFGGRYINYGTTQIVTTEINDIIYNNDGNAINGIDKTFYKANTVQINIDLALEDFTNVTNWTLVANGEEPVWSSIRGWPRTCTFHQGRLYFGGSRDKINSIWGSVVNVFFDFDVGTGAADDAIFDSIDSDQYNAINAIYSGRSLEVFSTGGEWYNTAVIMTPSNSGWKKQTPYGSIKKRPISIDGATLFVDSSKRSLRQFVWDFNEDSYVAKNITLISSHIVNDIQAIASITGTEDDVSDFAYVVNGDGTVSVMNSMRSEGIQGWTHWTTNGIFKDVVVSGKMVYFLVERSSETFIEYLREGTYTDHNVAIFGTAPSTFNVIDGTDNIVDGTDNIIFTDPSTGIIITEIQTDYADILTTDLYRVVADGAIQADSLVTVISPNVNKLVLPRNAYSAEVGIGFSVNITTLPLNVGTKENGQIVNLKKRVNRVILNLYKSLGVFVQSEFLGNQKFPLVLNEPISTFTGIKEVYLFGYVERLVTVEVTQEDPLPLTLLSIDSEIEG